MRKTAIREVPTALTIGICVDFTNPGTIRNPPPMPKKPESIPVPRPKPETFFQFFGVASSSLDAFVLAVAKHRKGYDQHQKREQKQEFLTVKGFAHR